MKTKIVPYYFDDDIEEEIRDSGFNVVGIESMSITYTQQADTCSPVEDVQTLTITTQTGISPGKEEAEKKEAFYFDITIPAGQHWSVEEGDELKALIEDFKQRIYMTTIHNDLHDERQEPAKQDLLLEEQEKDTGAPEGV